MSEKIERVTLNEDGSSTLRLRHVRLSFPYIFTPRKQKGDDGKEKKVYQCSHLFPRDGDPQENFAHAKVALDHAVNVGLKGKFPGRDRVCLKSGKDKGDQGVAGYDESMMFISTNSQTKPVCVDRFKRDGKFVTLTEEDGKLYAGCYVNATVRIWPMDSKDFGRRVCAQTKAIQFLEEGEAFGAPPANPDEEFSDSSEEEAPANIDDYV